jgi:cytochrome c oxidase subunit I
MATSIGSESESIPSLQSDLGLLRWIATVDHKIIGLLYLATALVFFIFGGCEALVMRLQLAQPGLKIAQPEQYDQLFTMHGVTMVFLFATPLVVGLSNYLVPLMIGARDVAFPRLNAMSYWLFLFGGLLLYYSVIGGDSPDTGWFSYAPLTSPYFSQGWNSDYWIIAIFVTGIGSIAGAINLAVTILTMRAPGMTLGRVPVFVWMAGITAILIITAFPTLTTDAILLFVDRQLGGHFFDAGAGGSAILWQHLFWWFGHPEVYIVILVPFGIISEVVPVFSRKPLFGYTGVVLSGVAIGFLSSSVWAHHMFTVGMGQVADVFFAGASMLIAIPTGIKIFNWLATMWRGAIRFTTSMLFAVGFIGTFVFGGLTGVSLAAVPVDWEVHNSYYLVGHFHYTFFGGTVLCVFAGLYYWFPKVTGRMLSERLGKLHFWTMLAGVWLTFFPMHLLGLQGMPREIYTYPASTGWGPLNLLVTIGAFLIAASVFIFFCNVIASLRHGAVAGDDPWDAWTLEWATNSPPPPYNFAEIPAVHSRRPLWDRKHVDQATPAPSVQQRGRPSGLRVSQPVLAVLLLILSETLIFLPLIAIYWFYRGLNPVGPAPRQVLDVGYTGIFTACLLSSSITIFLAERSLKRGKYRAMWVFLGLTILLALAFLAGEGSEWLRLLGRHLDPARSLFGSTYFTLTGMHGLHVSVGILAFLALAITFLAGDVRGRRASTALTAISIYWHFVDALWVVIFTTIYLWTLWR